jgi:hypothetical protein
MRGTIKLEALTLIDLRHTNMHRNVQLESLMSTLEEKVEEAKNPLGYTEKTTSLNFLRKSTTQPGFS